MDFRNREFRKLLQTLGDTVQQLTGENAPLGDGAVPGNRNRRSVADADHQRLLEILEQLEQYQDILENDASSESISSCAASHTDHFEAAAQEQPVSGEEKEPGASAVRDSGLPGTLGDFRIRRLIASGGMGTVYEAEQISLSRRVALKVLPFAALIDPRRLQRFKNEAQAAASLRHPNIVRIHAVGCDRGVHYFAMDYIEGRTLAELIQELRLTASCPDNPASLPETGSTKLMAPNDASHSARAEAADSHDDRRSAGLSETGNRTAGVAARPSDVDFELDVNPVSKAEQTTEFFQRVAAWGVQLCKALAHAHEMGVVHRDITPSNLIVDTAGNLWITDFGLATTRDQIHLTASGDVIGTLLYMSPEQAGRKGHPVDFHTDIYSLGATLYELLTLQPAFRAGDRHALLLQIIAGNVRPVSRHNKAVPWDLETIILKAMTAEPENRYHSAQEMADDFTRFLNNEPIRATRPTVPQRWVKWVRRNAQVVTVTCGAMFLLIIVMAFSVLVIGHARSDAVEQRRIAVEKQRLSERHQQQLRKNLYVADMTLGYEAWKIADLRCAVERLARYESQSGSEDLRDFAWHYLWTLCHQELQLFDGHAGDVYCAKFAPDQSTIATACGDGFVRLWSVATGRQLAALPTEQTEVNSVAFSHDNNLLAAACDGGMVCVWDLDDDRNRRDLALGREDVFSVAFSPDDTHLACGGCDKCVHLLETKSWRETGRLVGHTGNVESLAYSPSGDLIATSGADHTVRLWEPTRGELKETWGEHRKRVNVVCFSPDGKQLASADDLGIIHVRKLDNPEDVLTISAHATWIHGLAFSPGDCMLASGGKDGFIRLWNARTGDEENVLRGHVGRVWWVMFSRNGRYLLSAGADQTVRVWNPSARQEYQDGPAFSRVVTDLVVLPNYQIGSVCDTDDNVTIWSLAQPSLHRSIGARGTEVECISTTPDGKAMAVAYADGASSVWNPMTGEKICDLGNHKQRIRAIAISHDGKYVATGDEEEGIVRLWSVVTGSQEYQLDVKQWVLALAFTADSKRLSIGTTDGKILHLSTQSGKVERVVSAHSGSITGLVYSPDGTILASCSLDRMIKLWDTETGQLQASLVGHFGSVRSVAFSPDGRTLASGSDDGTVRLWSVATARYLITLAQPVGRPQSVSFSPDGSILVAAIKTPEQTGHVCMWYADSDLLHTQVASGKKD